MCSFFAAMWRVSAKTDEVSAEIGEVSAGTGEVSDPSGGLSDTSGDLGGPIVGLSGQGEDFSTSCGGNYHFLTLNDVLCSTKSDHRHQNHHYTSYHDA